MTGVRCDRIHNMETIYAQMEVGTLKIHGKQDQERNLFWDKTISKAMQFAHDTCFLSFLITSHMQKF